ncbi:MAG: pyridoxine 5'-phosphate synthase [Bacteroidota bacterium]
MTCLSVNLNKVALMRNARGGARPDVQRLARAGVEAGAAGITLHPRPDGRHARAADVMALADWLPAAGAELNVEGNPFAEAGPAGAYAFPGFLAILREARPVQATLVPDAADQLTSDHGWDLDRDGDRLEPIIADLKCRGCRVCLFVDPAPEAIRKAAALGADRVELYTGPYAVAAARGEAAASLEGYRAAAEAAQAAGLGVNAGHDLDLDNLGPFLAAVPHVAEVSIGQALVADALEMGLPEAVRRYLGVIAATSQ